MARAKTSIPVVPGSLEEAIPCLRALLRLTGEANGHLDQAIAWPTDNRVTNLCKGVNGLGRCGLTRRIDRNTVELTASAKAWIEDGDGLQLIRIFHENVRFVGELLFEISRSSKGLTHEEIRAIAADNYRLPWSNVHPGTVDRHLFEAASFLGVGGLADMSSICPHEHVGLGGHHARHRLEARQVCRVAEWTSAALSSASRLAVAAGSSQFSTMPPAVHIPTFQWRIGNDVALAPRHRSPFGTSTSTRSSVTHRLSGGFRFPMVSTRHVR